MALSVTIPAGTTTPYHVNILRIDTIIHQIEVKLEDGTNVWTSPEFNLGTVHTVGRKTLVGKLSFRYTYHAEQKMVILCGTDYPSADGMRLLTAPQGSEKFCIEHASQGGFLADDVYANRVWNYRTQLTPGAADVFKDIVRRANDAVIHALQTRGDHIVLIRHLPPEIPIQDYLNLCIVHKDGKFLGFYDPKENYAADLEIRPLGSELGGIFDVPEDDDFANIKGTSDDPYPDIPPENKKFESWIDVWKFAYHTKEPPARCSSYKFPNDYPCTVGGDLLGGHCLLGNEAGPVTKGESKVAFIIPICAAHNNVTYEGPMRAVFSQRAVWLLNYGN